MKLWYRSHALTKSGKEAKTYVKRICALLTKISGRTFYVNMIKWNKCYEGHIIDTGHCKSTGSDDFDNDVLSNDQSDPEIGMVFFGGHFSVKKDYDALSKAWMSLLEDCIGNSENGKIAQFHNLTDSLRFFGPHIDLNCKTIDKLEEILKEHKC